MTTTGAIADLLVSLRTVFINENVEVGDNTQLNVSNIITYASGIDGDNEEECEEEESEEEDFNNCDLPPLLEPSSEEQENTMYADIVEINKQIKNVNNLDGETCTQLHTWNKHFEETSRPDSSIESASDNEMLEFLNLATDRDLNKQRHLFDSFYKTYVSPEQREGLTIPTAFKMPRYQSYRRGIAKAVSECSKTPTANCSACQIPLVCLNCATLHRSDELLCSMPYREFNLSMINHIITMRNDELQTTTVAATLREITEKYDAVLFASPWKSWLKERDYSIAEHFKSQQSEIKVLQSICNTRIHSEDDHYQRKLNKVRWRNKGVLSRKSSEMKKLETCLGEEEPKVKNLQQKLRERRCRRALKRVFYRKHENRLRIRLKQYEIDLKRATQGLREQGSIHERYRKAFFSSIQESISKLNSSVKRGTDRASTRIIFAPTWEGIIEQLTTSADELCSEIYQKQDRITSLKQTLEELKTKKESSEEQFAASKKKRKRTSTSNNSEIAKPKYTTPTSMLFRPTFPEGEPYLPSIPRIPRQPRKSCLGWKRVKNHIRSGVMKTVGSRIALQESPLIVTQGNRREFNESSQSVLD